MLLSSPGAKAASLAVVCVDVIVFVVAKRGSRDFNWAAASNAERHADDFV
jgi:hypothetical protein